jgi:hypothetical protein
MLSLSWEKTYTYILRAVNKKMIPVETIPEMDKGERWRG